VVKNQKRNQQKNKDFLEKLYNQALHFLSYRPRSKQEIGDYLRRKFQQSQFNDSEKEKLEERVLIKLEDQALINDQEFALWWIEQRLTFRPRGQRCLYGELLQKGIKKEIIDRALKSIPEEDWQIAAEKIVSKGARVYQSLSFQKLRNKLTGLLARRGFEYSLIRKVIDEGVKK